MTCSIHLGHMLDESVQLHDSYQIGPCLRASLRRKCGCKEAFLAALQLLQVFLTIHNAFEIGRRLVIADDVVPRVQDEQSTRVGMEVPTVAREIGVETSD